MPRNRKPIPVDEHGNRIKEKRIRRWSVRPSNCDRFHNGYFRTVFLKIKNDPEIFFQHTRMTRPIYKRLVELTFMALNKRRTQETLTPQERLSLTIWHLAEGLPIGELAEKYLMGKATARLIIYETCQVIWEALSPLYLNEPTTERLSEIAEQYRINWDVPNCVGAIGGKQFAFSYPRIPKSGMSIPLLATCDADYSFTSATIGNNDNISIDGNIFHMFHESDFARAIQYEILPLPMDAQFDDEPEEGKRYPHFFVGDATFPLQQNLMRQYIEINMPWHKRILNYRLYRANQVVENAFGVMVARWRVLGQTLEYAPDKSAKIVLACVALHNLIMSNPDSRQMYCPPKFVDWELEDGQMHRGDWRDIVEGSAEVPFSETAMETGPPDALKLRDSLAKYFTSTGVLPCQDFVAQVMFED